MPGSYGAKKCAGVTLWYCSTRPRGRLANAARHRRDQGEVEDGEVAPARLGIGERPHLVTQVVVDRHGEDVGLMAHAAQQVHHAAGGVSDGIAAVRRGHPLIDDHRRATISRRSWVTTGPRPPHWRRAALWAAPDRRRGGTGGARRATRPRGPDPRSQRRRAGAAGPATAVSPRRSAAASRRNPSCSSRSSAASCDSTMPSATCRLVAT